MEITITMKIDKKELISKKKVEYEEEYRKYEIFREAWENKLDRLLYEIEELQGYEYQINEKEE